MAQFKATYVVDGDTFDVSFGWVWDGNKGSRVRAAGYDAPELNTVAGRGAKDKLERLILGKYVELGNAYKFDRGRLVCDVFYNGRNLADYFPEYR